MAAIPELIARARAAIREPISLRQSYAHRRGAASLCREPQFPKTSANARKNRSGPAPISAPTNPRLRRQVGTPIEVSPQHGRAKAEGFSHNFLEKLLQTVIQREASPHSHTLPSRREPLDESHKKAQSSINVRLTDPLHHRNGSSVTAPSARTARCEPGFSTHRCSSNHVRAPRGQRQSRGSPSIARRTSTPVGAAR